MTYKRITITGTEYKIIKQANIWGISLGLCKDLNNYYILELTSWLIILNNVLKAACLEESFKYITLLIRLKGLDIQDQIIKAKEKHWINKEN